MERDIDAQGAGAGRSGQDTVHVPGVIVSARPLTKTQRQFNKLVERLNAQREELAEWQAFRGGYRQRVAAEYQPLTARLRASRIAMVTLLDRALDGEGLGKRQRDKARDIIGLLLAELLAEGEDPALVHIYDKYAEVSFAHEQRDRFEAMRAAAKDELGLDVDAYDGTESVDEFSDWLEAQLHAAADPAATPRGPKSERALEREALREEAAEGGTRAVREVFRKLASELHPDREPDPAERARKTELMKEVNQAYRAGDLLALFELQLGIEQLDPAMLADFAEEKLLRYVHVLEEQSRRLREELAELVAPFLSPVRGARPRKLTPSAIHHALDNDIRELKGVVRNLERDVAFFQDVRALKQSLNGYHVEPASDEDEPPDEPMPRGRRRR